MKYLAIAITALRLVSCILYVYFVYILFVYCNVSGLLRVPISD